MLSYCVVSSVFTPRVRILRKGRTYVFGRDRKCDFPLPSDVVSRRHAELRWVAKGGFEMLDLGSKNGTKVNKEMIEQRELKDGDSIWLGPFNVMYREYAGDIAGLLAETDSNESTASMSRNILGGEEGGFVFGGRFAGSELLEICQLIGLNEKSGVLNVNAGENFGCLAFHHGRVVRAQFAGVGGEEGAFALLAASLGSFEFVAGHPGEEDFSMAVDSLIMEAARRRDECHDTHETKLYARDNSSSE